MPQHPMKLVTVVSEAFAREPLLRLLEAVGAHGFTLSHVEGAGAQGSRVADIEEFGNIKVEVILPEATAETLLARLEAEFFPRYTMIAYTADVGVLRRQKF